MSIEVGISSGEYVKLKLESICVDLIRVCILRCVEPDVGWVDNDLLTGVVYPKIHSLRS